ncbi:MAG TPA: hypothetical protein VKB59_18730, partial [Micromonosporaceae bacterium]|nr:hypothetical protein [Micromonosporaceae bacterium]
MARPPDWQPVRPWRAARSPAAVPHRPVLRPVLPPALRPVLPPALRPVLPPALRPVLPPVLRPVLPPVRSRTRVGWRSAAAIVRRPA